MPTEIFTTGWGVAGVYRLVLYSRSTTLTGPQAHCCPVFTLHYYKYAKYGNNPQLALPNPDPSPFRTMKAKLFLLYGPLFFQGEYEFNETSPERVLCCRDVVHTFRISRYCTYHY